MCVCVCVCVCVCMCMCDICVYISPILYKLSFIIWVFSHEQ